jgi:hypothetical protein
LSHKLQLNWKIKLGIARNLFNLSL